MIDPNVVSLFHSLRGPYSRAAAGLIDDVCTKLAWIAQERPDDAEALSSLVQILADCFRPMDAGWPPDCHAWDQAYSTFGRWLWRDNDVLTNAVRQITNWPDEKLVECKNEFRRSVFVLRDEWTRAANDFSNMEDQ